MQSEHDSDAAYARQLQDEEFSSAGYRPPKPRSSSDFEDVSGNPAHAIGPSSSSEAGEPQRPPVLERVLSAPVGVVARQPQHRAVQQNAADQARNIQEHSPTLLGLFIFFGIAELVTATVMLAKGADSYCDRPLATWIGVYCARWFLLIPLAIARFRRRHMVFTAENRDPLLRYQSWIRFAAFGWMLVGQYWYFTSSCAASAPYLSKFTLALIIIFYIGLFLPLILLLLMCLCLPCTLLLLQFLQSPGVGGAPADLIATLPKRTFAPPGADHAEGEPPSCAVCMDDYKVGDELRQ
jgi:hypothetical protein